MIAINAEHYPAQLELAKLRAKRGDNAAAAAALEGAVYIYPYDIELHQDLAGYQTALGNWDRVARARRALLALDPVDKAEAHYQLAFAYERAGNRSSARSRYYMHSRSRLIFSARRNCCSPCAQRRPPHGGAVADATDRSHTSAPGPAHPERHKRSTDG